MSKQIICLQEGLDVATGLGNKLHWLFTLCLDCIRIHLLFLKKEDGPDIIPADGNTRGHQRKSVCLLHVGQKLVIRGCVGPSPGMNNWNWILLHGLFWYKWFHWLSICQTQMPRYHPALQPSWVLIKFPLLFSSHNPHLLLHHLHQIPNLPSLGHWKNLSTHPLAASPAFPNTEYQHNVWKDIPHPLALHFSPRQWILLAWE